MIGGRRESIAHIMVIPLPTEFINVRVTRIHMRWLCTSWKVNWERYEKLSIVYEGLLEKILKSKNTRLVTKRIIFLTIFGQKTLWNKKYTCRKVIPSLCQIRSYQSYNCKVHICEHTSKLRKSSSCMKHNLFHLPANSAACYLKLIWLLKFEIKVINLIRSRL